MRGFAWILVVLAACGSSSSSVVDAARDGVGGDGDITELDAADAPTDGATDGATDAPIDGPDVDAPVDAPIDAAVDASLCGNGVVDPGETCDGDCPTSCADLLTCTTDVLVGTPGTCDVACLHAGTGCAAGDGCCSPGCDATTDGDCPFTMAPYYDPLYDVRDLGTAPGLPTNYGGLTVAYDDPSVLLIGGAANNATGAIYALGLQRDPQGHIVGITGPATLARAGAYNDGGVVFDAAGVLVLARYPVNELGMQRAGSTVDDKVVPLAPLGVATSVGGLAQVPAGYPGAGAWKLVSWPGGQWYQLTLVPDATGTYDVTAGVLRLTIGGGPEGIAYVPLSSPLFPNPSVLVSEYSAGRVATYEIDTQGDPVLASRRDLITNLTGAEGAAIDPVSGDFLFSTFGGGNRIVVVRGFAGQ